MIFLFLSFSIVVFQEPTISEVRKLYQQSAEDEAAAEKLLKISEENDDTALLLGYRAAAEMMLAKHVANPFSKMSHFKKGKKIFSEAIEDDPSNLELRFLRFSVQSETPGFLGYKDNLEEDEKILFLNLKKMKDLELKRIILEFLTKASALSEDEKVEMRNQLSKMKT